MADKTRLPHRSPPPGDMLVIIALGAAAVLGIAACEVVTFRAAAAHVGPELTVRACDPDRPGVCQTRTFPTCDIDAAAERLAAEGLVIRMATCAAAIREA